MATTSTGPDLGAGIGARTPYLMLGMATLGFAVNFWAWRCSARSGRCSARRARSGR